MVQNIKSTITHDKVTILDIDPTKFAINGRIDRSGADTEKNMANEKMLNDDMQKKIGKKDKEIINDN